MSKRPRGPLPDWEPTTPLQRGILADLEARYAQHDREGTLERGPRGIFYDLRPDGMGNGVSYRKPDSEHPVSAIVNGKRVRLFGPMEAHPENVREVLVLARRAGIIPEDWVADTRAPEPMHSGGYRDADHFAQVVAEAARDFKLVRQEGQLVYVETLCEAEDLMPRLHRVADEYGVHVYSGAGFDGLKAKREMAERALDREFPTVVLHVGDYDWHGENIYRAAAEDAIAWAGGLGEVALPEDTLAELRERYLGRGPALIFYRLALTKAQAEDAELLDADGKAEVDGLPVPVMDKLLVDAIEVLHDPARREAVLQRQQKERADIPEALGRLLADG